MGESGFDGQTPMEGAPESATPVESSGQPTSAAEQRMFELKWQGKTQRVPEPRAIELAQMGFDYTQKMQDLARQREQVQNWATEKQQYEAAIQEVRQFLSDRNRLRQYVQQMEGQHAEGADDPNALLTQQQVQQMLAQQAQQLQGMTAQQMQALQMKMQVDQLADRYTQDFDNHIRNLKEQMPTLKGIPKIDKLIKDDVAAMRPRGPDEAKQFMVEVARNYAEQARQYFLNERKTEGTAPNPALQRGIEPPGGAGPMPPAQPAFKGKMGDAAFKNLVMQDMERILAQNRG